MKYSDHFRVAIFGSARIKRKDPRYKLVETLAKMIAKEKIDVVTGGGPGLMEAANKGHKEGRGKNKVHSFGLNINLAGKEAANMHLDVKEDFKRFSKRLDKFMTLSNVVVVAPGGIGTTLELFYTWQLVQVEHICETPIILLGDMWKDLIKWVEKHPLKKKLMDKKDMNNIFFAKNCTEAMKIIKTAHLTYQKGKEHICTNLKRYK